MSIVRCPNCDFNVSDEDGVCFICGAKLNNAKAGPVRDPDADVSRKHMTSVGDTPSLAEVLMQEESPEENVSDVSDDSETQAQGQSTEGDMSVDSSKVKKKMDMDSMDISSVFGELSHQVVQAVFDSSDDL